MSERFPSTPEVSKSEAIDAIDDGIIESARIEGPEGQLIDNPDAGRIKDANAAEAMAYAEKSPREYAEERFVQARQAAEKMMKNADTLSPEQRSFLQDRARAYTGLAKQELEEADARSKVALETYRVGRQAMQEIDDLASK